MNRKIQFDWIALVACILSLFASVASAQHDLRGLPGNDDDVEVETLLVELPVDEFGFSLVDWSTLEIVDDPAYGFLLPSEDFSSIEYVPEWSGIITDSFEITAELLSGDTTLVLLVEYSGETGGAIVSYNLAVADPDAPRWHHELPQGIFGDKGKYKIPGIDQDFIDQAKYGRVLRHKDHYKKNGIHFPFDGENYNKEWKTWLDKFKEQHGHLPNKGEVLGKLNDFRIKYREILSKGFRPRWDYD